MVKDIKEIWDFLGISSLSIRNEWEQKESLTNTNIRLAMVFLECHCMLAFEIISDWATGVQPGVVEVLLNTRLRYLMPDPAAAHTSIFLEMINVSILHVYYSRKLYYCQNIYHPNRIKIVFAKGMWNEINIISMLRAISYFWTIKCTI